MITRNDITTSINTLSVTSIGHFAVGAYAEDVKAQNEKEILLVVPLLLVPCTYWSGSMTDSRQTVLSERGNDYFHQLPNDTRLQSKTRIE